MPDYSDVFGTAIDEKRVTALSDLSAVICLSALTAYQQKSAWQDGDNAVSDAQFDIIDKAIAQAESELMRGMIGLILPSALGSLSNLNVLECDGTSYLREDYPELYAALDSAFIIDADNFSVPDLRAKFVLGADGIDYNVGDSGGEVEHTLLVGEMPSHSHTNTPHSHSEIAAVAALADFGTGAPVPSATPLPSTTGLASVTIDNAGNDEPHNNMPPFLALRWVIIAG
jgi:microcystin-dependent protein